MDAYFKPEAERPSAVGNTGRRYRDDNCPEAFDLPRLRRDAAEAAESGGCRVLIVEGLLTLWDRALYEGKFYVYFGVAPVLLVYYPFYFLTGALPTDATLMGILSVAGVAFITLLFLELVRRFAPHAPFLLVLLGRGASEISSDFGLNQSFADILTGVILFFIIGSEFFINYQVHFRRAAKSAQKEGGANV